MKEENEKEDYEAGEEEGAKEAEFLPGRCICRLMKAFCGQEQEQGILLGGLELVNLIRSIVAKSPQGTVFLSIAHLSPVFRTRFECVK